jgi:hypothetical protein
MKEENEVPTLVPLIEVARLLGMSVPAVYRAVARHDISLAPIGGRKRVSATQIERIIQRSLTRNDFPKPTTEVAPPAYVDRANVVTEAIDHDQHEAA